MLDGMIASAVWVLGEDEDELGAEAFLLLIVATRSGKAASEEEFGESPALDEEPQGLTDGAGPTTTTFGTARG